MKLGSLHNQMQVDNFCRMCASRRQAMSDAKVRGLQLERLASGQTRWRLRYLSNKGRARSCITLGDAHILSLADARQLAENELRNMVLGKDPKQFKQAASVLPSFATFIEEQYLPYVKSYKRSWRSDLSLLNNHLLPRFGSKCMDEITRQDIVRMLCERRASGAAAGSANRLLIIMRFIFNLAIRWELPGMVANPTKNVPMLEENNKRERYLNVEETQRLYKAVCESDNPMLRFIVPMLILTGARKREVLDAKWQDLDFERRMWRIPISKSGKARHVPLSDGVIALLLSLNRDNTCEWPFANPLTGKPYVSIFWAWNSARCKVGLKDVRVHDLRHSHASFLVNAGRTLYEVQHILGHTQVKTTQRYAHLKHDTLLEATNSVNKTLGSIFMPGVSTQQIASM